MKYTEIIKRAVEKHGEKYSYPKFDEKLVTDKMEIICPIHGKFEQTIYAHLRGENCPKCAGKRRGYTTEDFIHDAKEKFGDKFDYSKSIYRGKRNKVCIMCKELITENNPSGEFWQKPFTHIESKDGMPFNGKRGKQYNKITDETEIRIKTKQFIDKAKEVHRDKYDYSKVRYEGMFIKVCIICPIHGEFWQLPSNHLRGCGCKACANIVPITKDEFISKAKKVHGDKYDYSKVEIKKSNDKLCIICPIHGEFYQTISDHLRGRGCPKCARNKKITYNEFVERAKQVHDNKYDYSKVEYVNNHTKVCIICPKHGEFWQRPVDHLKGAGCPVCKESSLEREICSLLIENNIEYERQKKFKSIKHKSYLPFDFYLPKYNTAIECQGIEHFEKHHFFNDEERFLKDKIKYDGCVTNGIKLLYYTNIQDFERYFNGIYSKDNLLSNKEMLLEKIKG